MTLMNYLLCLWISKTINWYLTNLMVHFKKVNKAKYKKSLKFKIKQLKTFIKILHVYKCRENNERASIHHPSLAIIKFCFICPPTFFMYFLKGKTTQTLYDYLQILYYSPITINTF